MAASLLVQPCDGEATASSASACLPTSNMELAPVVHLNISLSLTL
jgi:hypothetical protein